MYFDENNELKNLFKSLESDKTSADFTGTLMQQLLHQEEYSENPKTIFKKELVHAICIFLGFLLMLLMNFYGGAIIEFVPDIVLKYFSNLIELFKRIFDVVFSPFGILVGVVILFLYFADIFIQYQSRLSKH